MFTITDKSEGEESRDNVPPIECSTVEDAWADLQQFILPGTRIQDGDAPCLPALTKARFMEQMRVHGVASIWYDGALDASIVVEQS